MEFLKTELADQIPTDVVGNLKWRMMMYMSVTDEVVSKHDIHDACMRDPVFFMNAFAWTYDPRAEPFPRVPFILYDFQEDVLLSLINAINKHDILIEKSRDMGASWLCISALFWRWLFMPMQSFLLVSRTENYVDEGANPKSLMWKWDFLLNNIPPWLRPKGYNAAKNRRKLHIENPENGSVCNGESTNKKVARGDRRTAILLDEFAAVEQGRSVLSSTRDATNCRIFNSTPEGTANAFFDMRETNIKKLRMHWSQHPIKATGLYKTSKVGDLVKVDEKGYPHNYQCILDGKLRSPWYDEQCERASSFREIAQELDIDYLGSGHQFFNPDLVQFSIREHAMRPTEVGDLDYDMVTAEPTSFRRDSKGKLQLWTILDRDFRPSKEHRYVMGIDVSSGTGSSNSCVSVWDVADKAKVAEYVSPYIRPEAFAKQAVALGVWFGNAYMIWESAGPGRQFGSRVLELGYRNIYYRKSEEALSRKITDIPGWSPTRDTKLQMMGAYRDAIEKNRCMNRSKEALLETLEYVFVSSGGVEHSRATDRGDPSGAGRSHGDRVIADGLAWKVMADRQHKITSTSMKAPVGSLAWRQNLRSKVEISINLELGEGWR